MSVVKSAQEAGDVIGAVRGEHGKKSNLVKSQLTV